MELLAGDFYKHQACRASTATLQAWWPWLQSQGLCIREPESPRTPGICLSARSAVFHHGALLLTLKWTQTVRNWIYSLCLVGFATFSPEIVTVISAFPRTLAACNTSAQDAWLWLEPQEVHRRPSRPLRPETHFSSYGAFQLLLGEREPRTKKRTGVSCSALTRSQKLWTLGKVLPSHTGDFVYDFFIELGKQSKGSTLYSWFLPFSVWLGKEIAE